jgi:regulator of replication initiation timing
MSDCIITENARLREENERLKSGGPQQSNANEWDAFLSQARLDKEKLHDEIQSLSAREQVANYHLDLERKNSSNLSRKVDELLLEIQELRAELAAWRASTRKNPEADAVRIGGWGKGKDE